MIRRSTLITLIIFFILLGAAYGLKQYQKKHPTGTPTPTPEATAFNYKTEDVVEIKITSGHSVVDVKRKDPKSPWQMVTPKGKADQGRINAALYDLTMLTVINTPAEHDLKALGLDKPMHVVTVRLKDGTKWTMEVGAQTPIKSGYYVKIGDKIMVIDSYPIEGLKELLSNPPIIRPTPTKAPTGTITPAPTSGAQPTAPPTPTPTQ